MGVAAYHRGSRSIHQHAEAQQRPVAFAIMEHLNTVPKTADAVSPFRPIHFRADHHGWWAECPTTGFGYCYASLSEAVSHWHVTITTYAGGRWIGTPTAGAAAREETPSGGGAG